MGGGKVAEGQLHYRRAKMYRLQQKHDQHVVSKLAFSFQIPLQNKNYPLIQFPQIELAIAEKCQL